MLKILFEYLMTFTIIQYVVGWGLIIFPLIVLARIYSFIKSKIIGTEDEYKNFGYIFPKWKIVSWSFFLLIFAYDTGEDLKSSILEVIALVYFIIAEIKDYKIRKELEKKAV